MIRNADVTIHPFLSVVKMQCFITSKTLRLCYAEVMILRRERFAEWLNAQIQGRGWTQAEFARQASTTPATVSRVLSGENNPGLDFLQGVATAFNLQPEIVLRNIKDPIEVREIIRKATLTEKKRRNLAYREEM